MRLDFWKASTLTLAAALALAVGGNFVGSAEAAPQPHMTGALALLQQAQTQLEKATHDKDGHRIKAIEHIKSAIAEVNAGIAASNAKHDDAPQKPKTERVTKPK